MSDDELNLSNSLVPYFKVVSMGGNAVLLWPLYGTTVKEQYIWGESEARHTQMMEGLCRELNKRVDMINEAKKYHG